MSGYCIERRVPKHNLAVRFGDSSLVAVVDDRHRGVA